MYKYTACISDTLYLLSQYYNDLSDLNSNLGNIPMVNYSGTYSDITEWIDDNMSDNYKVTFVFSNAQTIPYSYSLYMCWRMNEKDKGVVCFRRGFIYIRTASNSVWGDWATITATT